MDLALKFANFAELFDACIMSFGYLLFNFLGLLLLTHHDDGEENELKESLSDPGDDDEGVTAFECRGKGDHGDCSKEVGTPHRRNATRNRFRDPLIERFLFLGH